MHLQASTVLRLRSVTHFITTPAAEYPTHKDVERFVAGVYQPNLPDTDKVSAVV